MHILPEFVGGCKMGLKAQSVAQEAYTGPNDLLHVIYIGWTIHVIHLLDHVRHQNVLEQIQSSALVKPDSIYFRENI